METTFVVEIIYCDKEAETELAPVTLVYGNYADAREKAENTLNNAYKGKEDEEFYELCEYADFSPSMVEVAIHNEIVYNKRLFSPDMEEIIQVTITKAEKIGGN